MPGEVNLNNLTINFKSVDLPKLSFGVDYYFYRLQYKLAEQTEDDYRDIGGFQQHFNYGAAKWMTFSVGLKEDTSFHLRVALYRRVEYRGWLDLCDVSQSVTLKTQSLTWRQNGEYEYMFSQENALSALSFFDASEYCQTVGGLVSILSKSEMDYLYTTSITWIGLKVPDSVGSYSFVSCYICRNGQSKTWCVGCIQWRSAFAWTDGNPVTNTFWEYDEPSRGEKCATLYKDLWFSASCSATKPFICKRGVNGSSDILEYPEGSVSDQEHCERSSCKSCQKWYIYSALNPKGNCVNYLEKISLPSSMNITEGTMKDNNATVRFRSADLSIPAYAADYYFYGLQYRPAHDEESGVEFKDAGNLVKHYIGEQRWHTINTEVDVKENTKYLFRVALYRMVALRQWKELSDVSEAIAITSGNLTWLSHDKNWYMLSNKNSISRRNFEEAQAYCQLLGSNLSSILTVPENEFLENLDFLGWIGYNVPEDIGAIDCYQYCPSCSTAIDKGSSEDCAKCLHCRSLWTWLDGSPSGYTFWRTASPSSNNRCGYMCNDGFWCDYTCSRDYNFVCKRSNTILGSKEPSPDEITEATIKLASTTTIPDKTPESKTEPSTQRTTDTTSNAGSTSNPSTVGVTIQHCPDIWAPDHSTLEESGFEAGATATYTCDPGYTLVGVSQRTCLNDGTWSGSEPSCISDKTPESKTEPSTQRTTDTALNTRSTSDPSADKTPESKTEPSTQRTTDTTLNTRSTSDPSADKTPESKTELSTQRTTDTTLNTRSTFDVSPDKTPESKTELSTQMSTDTTSHTGSTSNPPVGVPGTTTSSVIGQDPVPTSLSSSPQTNDNGVLFGAVGGLGGLILIAIIAIPLAIYLILKRRDSKPESADSHSSGYQTVQLGQQPTEPTVYAGVYAEID